MKLSILVVTYNQEHYIRQALDSILMQQVNFDYEVIISDDCSTDSTPAICDEFAKPFSFPQTPISHIRVYHQETNKGVVHNWEYVLNHCHGEYIAILEGDDFWNNTNKLQTQVDYMDSHPDVALTFTGVNVLYEGGNIDNEHLFDHLNSRVYSLAEVYGKWSILSSSVVFRRCPVIPISYPKDIYFCDTFTFMRIMQYGLAYCIAEPWTTYRRHASNISRKENREVAIKCANQHKYIGLFFPQIRKLAQQEESTYLKMLIYDRQSKDTWRYRLRYMWLNKQLLFSRFAIATIHYILK